MMPSQYVNGWLALVSGTYGGTGGLFATKFWWDVTAGDLSWLVGMDMDAFLTGISQAWRHSLAAMIPSNWGSSYGNMLAHHSGTDFTFYDGSAILGTLSTDWYAGAYSVCIMKRTTKPGRSGIGRIFIPALLKQHVYHGIITDLGFAFYQTKADFLNGTFTYPSPSGNVTVRPCLHSLQDNDLTPIVRLDVLRKPTYLYRRRIRT